MNKKKIIISVLVGVLIISTSIAAVAGGYLSAEKKSGNFSSKILDRVSFEIDNTVQEFSLASLNDGQCIFQAELTAQKNEADFYAMINSITASGFDFSSVVVTPLQKFSEVCEPNGGVMPAKDGKAIPVGWDIKIYFTPNKKGTINGSIEVDYTSGAKKNVANRQILQIPIQIVVS